MRHPRDRVGWFRKASSSRKKKKKRTKQDGRASLKLSESRPAVPFCLQIEWNRVSSYCADKQALSNLEWSMPTTLYCVIPA